MNILPSQSMIRKIVTILLALGGVSFLFAQEPSDSTANRVYISSHGVPEEKKGTVIFREDLSTPDLPLEKEENLSSLQKQARSYRRQGLEFQRIGNIDVAMSLYQKAIQLDPAYAVVYNDLGIIHEIKGTLERAEECYLKSIKIDPQYPSAYANLALLYENKRDLDKAAFYWSKRAELGSSDDPWAGKAKQRLDDIRLVLQGGFSESNEQEIIRLMREVVNQKTILNQKITQKQDNQILADKYFEKAKQSYHKLNYAAAIKEALDAQQLDPANKEIEEFIEKAQLRALSK